MKDYKNPFFSETKYIKNQSATLAEERLAFLDGEFESAVLSDFNKEADKIDAKYADKG